MAAFDGSKQRGHKQPSWPGGSLTFPLPSSWTPTIAIHAVPSIAVQLHTPKPTQRVPTKTSSILPVSIKANQPVTASAPECKTSSSCTSTSQDQKPHQDVPTPNYQGDEVSAKKLLGELWGLQLAHSPMKLWARNHKSARGQSLRVSIRPLRQAASFLLHRQTRDVSDHLCRV